VSGQANWFAATFHFQTSYYRPNTARRLPDAVT
jgi:hypothetical protein